VHVLNVSLDIAPWDPNMLARFNLIRPRDVLAFLSLSIFAASWTAPAEAGLTFANMFRTNSYFQYGNGNSLNSQGSYLTFGLEYETTGEFDSAQVTYPGAGSPTALSPAGPNEFFYGSGGFADQAAMDAAYPFGTYKYDASGTGGPASTQYEYAADAYPQSIPYLKNGSWLVLQGATPSAAIPVEFSPYIPTPGVTEAYLFFTIFDHTLGTTVYSANFLPSNVTSLLIPANTLAAYHDFSYELIFSDRVALDAPGSLFAAQIGYDYRTRGDFSTVPEPSTLVLALAVLAPLAAAIRRKLR
jgi:hypothetical protein